MRLRVGGFRFVVEDCRHGGAKLEIAGRRRWRRQLLQFTLDETGINGVGAHIRMRQQRRKEGNVGDDAANVGFLKPAIKPLNRGGAGRAPHRPHWPPCRRKRPYLLPVPGSCIPTPRSLPSPPAPRSHLAPPPPPNRS